MRRLVTFFLLSGIWSVAFANTKVGPIYTGHKANDAYQYNSTLLYKNTGALLVGDYGEPFNRAAVRFPGITVDKGVTIDSARLGFRGYSGGYTTDSCRLKIWGEKVDNPDTIPDGYTAFGTRVSNSTTAQVTWAPVPGYSGSLTRYVSVTSIVQELVNRTGWSNGNAMLFVLDDSSSQQLRDFYSWDGDSTTPKAPLIEIWWSGTGGGGTPTQVVRRHEPAGVGYRHDPANVGRRHKP